MKLKRFYKKHGAYYFVDTANKWHHLGRDYAKALQKYAELLDRPTQGPLADLFQRYLKEVIPTKAPRTQKDNLGELQNLTKAFGHMRPAEVTPQHIYSYMDARQAKTRANREKALLSHVFKYAIRWGYVTDNPCAHVESFKEQPRRRYIPDEVFWAIFEHAVPFLQRAMLVAVTTGLRPADILGLTWRNVSPDGLVVKPGKTRRSTGHTLVFPWSSGLTTAIFGSEAVCCRDSDEFLIYVDDPRSAVTVRSVQHYWRKARLAAFPDGSHDFSFRDIRVKVGSDSLNNQLLGNTRAVFDKFYNVKPRVVPALDLPPKKTDS